jgi:hypothetical protein
MKAFTQATLDQMTEAQMITIDGLLVNGVTVTEPFVIYLPDRCLLGRITLDSGATISISINKDGIATFTQLLRLTKEKL